MFEPENDLERSLVRAALQPEHRPEFMRMLMDAEVFLALIPSGGKVATGPDGKLVVPPGVKLELNAYRRGDQAFLPFFTRPSRARALLQVEHVIAPDKTRDLFQRHPNTQFALNPGSDYGQELLAADVERLLSGDFGDGLQNVNIEQATDVFVEQPIEYPAELVTVLSAIFDDIPSVQAAYLGEVTLPGEDPHLHIAIDAAGDWNAVVTAMGPRLQSALPSGAIIDFAPLAGSMLEDYFRNSTEPFFVRRTS